MIMLRKVLYLFFCFALMTPVSSFAQVDAPEIQEDFEVWTSINLEKEFLQHFEADFEGSYRVYDNATRLKGLLGELGVTYKHKKWLRVKIAYRIASRVEYTEHRLKGDLILQAEIYRFEISLRNRLQREWVVNKEPKDFLRERLKLSYNINNFPLDPFIAGEAWFRFSNVENQCEEFRADVGFEWGISKKSDLALFYRIMDEVNVNNPLRAHVLGLEFTYSFD